MTKKTISLKDSLEISEKNCNVFLGDVRNINIFKKIIAQSKKDKIIIME